MRHFTPRRPGRWPRNSTSRSSPPISPICAPPVTSASAPNFRICSTSTSAASARRPPFKATAAGRHRARLGRQDRRHAAPDGRRARWCRPARTRPRDPRRRLLQDPAAGRPPAYTRDGSFELDSQGRMVTAQGNLRASRPTIPQNAHGGHAQRAGPGFGDHPGTDAPTVVGQIELAMFVNKAGHKIGDNLYLETPASGVPQNGHPDHRRLRQSAARLPRAGQCRAVSEISDLIAAQRAYEMNAKVITATDQMLSTTSRLLR